MSTTFLATMNHYTCPVCGVIYGLEANLDRWRHEDGKSFYCSNGHSLSYKETALMRSEKAAARAQELLYRERNLTANLQAGLTHMDKRRQAEMAAKTRIKNRVARGVCICCNRSFENLARHMKSKHPDELDPPK